MTTKNAAVGNWAPFGGSETLLDPASVPQSVTAKLRRQSMRKRGGQAMAAVLREFAPRLESSDHGKGEVLALCDKIGHCGSWLLLRERGAFASVASGNFCQNHLLCSACAAVRARRHVQRYAERVATVPDVLPYHLTLTMPSVIGRSAAATGTDHRSAAAAAFRAECEALRSGVDTLLHGWRCLWARRKVGRAGGGPLGCVSGAVVAVEVTRNEPAGWHPHLHCLLLCHGQEQVEINDLRSAWCKLTGGRMMRVDRVKGFGGLLECLKYAVKPSELRGGEIDPEGAFWRFMAYRALSGRRLVFGYGSLYGVPEPDLDETEADPGDGWREWWAKWFAAVQRYEVVPSRDEAQNRWRDES